MENKFEKIYNEIEIVKKGDYSKEMKFYEYGRLKGLSEVYYVTGVITTTEYKAIDRLITTLVFCKM